MDFHAVAPAFSFVVDDSCPRQKRFAEELSEQFGIVVSPSPDGELSSGHNGFFGMFLNEILAPEGSELITLPWDCREVLLLDLPPGKDLSAGPTQTVAILGYSPGLLVCRYANPLVSDFPSVENLKRRVHNLLDLFVGDFRRSVESRLAQAEGADPVQVLMIAKNRDDGVVQSWLCKLARVDADHCRGLFVLEVSAGNPGFASEGRHSFAADRREVRLGADLPQALHTGQTTFFLHPVYDTDQRRFVGAEALARWNHPELGMVMPGEFIPLFEKLNMVRELDLCILESVCSFQRSLLEKGISPLPVSVNLSPIDFYDFELAKNILSIVDRFGIPHELVCFEVTESAYMGNKSLLVNTLEQLKAQRFTILLDDFGSGYSSLEILTRAPIDILKIDMGFTRQIGCSRKVEAALEMLVGLASNLGIGVIAEGVEDEGQTRFFRSVGCRMIQGYLYAKPMDCPTFERCLSC